MAILTQLANIYYFLSLSSAAVRYVFSSFLQHDASFLSTYPLKASLENSGSLAKAASSSIKWIRSANSCSVECLLLIFMKFLFHFPLMFPGNFDSTNHIISGVSSTFQFCPSVTLSYFSRKL